MKVTVIMAAYNAERFVGQAIESVLNQTYKDFQFIIINDGSTDKTLQIIESYAINENRILIDSHTNIGKGESINRVVELFAKGDYLFHFDADDLMLPNRIERQLAFLELNTGVDAISCLAYYIGADNKVIGKTYSELGTLEAFNKYLNNNEPIGLLNPGFVIKKSKFIEVGGYRGEFWPCDDIDIYNRLTEIGVKILVQSEILMQYRIHGNSVITSKFINSRIKFEWVRESMWSRRRGEEEPSWEAYLKSLEKRPFMEKLNWKRKTYAKHYYRTAGFDFAQKKYFKFALHLLGAAILQPVYVFKKIKKQHL